VATIREYFDKAAERVLTAVRTVRIKYPHGELEVLVQVHCDFDANVRYLSLFLPKCAESSRVCQSLLEQVIFLLAPQGDVNVKLPLAADVYGGFHVFNHGPEKPIELNALPLCEPQIRLEDLPFSGTLFVYTENSISEVDLALLKDHAQQRKINLRWRGVSFAQERSAIERPIAFISHDSNDKQEIARPLALRLQQMVCPVWFDEFSLGVGDSLRESIEKGLRETEKCIVILSPSFLANKRWAKIEFNSVFTREIIEERNVFLPIWHNVTAKDIYEYSSSLANRLGVQWSLGLDEVARQIYREISKARLMPAGVREAAQHE
jgi:hypothetical protein